MTSALYIYIHVHKIHHLVFPVADLCYLYNRIFLVTDITALCFTRQIRDSNSVMCVIYIVYFTDTHTNLLTRVHTLIGDEFQNRHSTAAADVDTHNIQGNVNR